MQGMALGSGVTVGRTDTMQSSPPKSETLTHKLTDRHQPIEPGEGSNADEKIVAPLGVGRGGQAVCVCMCVCTHLYKREIAAAGRDEVGAGVTQLKSLKQVCYRY